MKKVVKGIVFLTLIVACGTLTRTNEFIGGWKEKEQEFMNSVPHLTEKNELFNLILEFKYYGIHNEFSFEWLRKPANILALHETLKAINYKKILSKENYYKKIGLDDESMNPSKYLKGSSLDSIVKSLIAAYAIQPSVKTNYYHAFWERRIKEENAEEVLLVLKEVKEIYSKTNKEESYESSKVNDTIKKLIEFDLSISGNGFSKELLGNYFSYLKSLELNHSAYNLVIEHCPGCFPKDSIYKVLDLDTITEETYWRTRNNAVWISSYKDNGP